MILSTKESVTFFLVPRRFGKSLLVSTLQCLFAGEKELFQGLYIHDKWDWSTKYPVVRISFGGGKVSTPEDIEGNVHDQLASIERNEKLGLSLSPSGSAAGRFQYILELLHIKYKKQVVVLIDEYDKPVLDVIHKPDQAVTNRDCLREIYGMIKDHSHYIDFVFITGITMFSKANLFSGLNNLTNISLEPEFATICGYTDHDLDTVFAEEMKEFDREKIKKWYNGYNWLGKENVYNPYGVLTLFRKKRFKDWWFDTSLPSYLYQFLQQKHVEFNNLNTGFLSESIFSTFDVENLSIEALLFQSGYLTITATKEDDDGEILFRLGFPNYEIKKYFSERFLEYITKQKHVKEQGRGLIKLLEQNDFQGFADKLKTTLAGIPNEWHRDRLAEKESWYATVLFLHFSMHNLTLHPEESTARGRSDLVLELAKQIFIFEFKMVAKAKDTDKLLDQAMTQIREKEYGKKYQGRGQPIHLIALVFGKEERGLLDHRHELI